MDWNDPDELRRLRDLLAADPSATVTTDGPAGPVTDTVEMLVGRLGMPDLGGSYFTFSNENNDLIWGFLKKCHRRGWIYKGHDSMPWCPRCGTGPVADGDERGLPGSRGSWPDHPPAAASTGRASRSSSGRPRPGRSPRTSPRRSAPTCATSRCARARQPVGRPGPAPRGARRRHRGRRGEARLRAGRLALQRPVRRAAGDRPGVLPTPATSTGSSRGTTSARRRGPGSSTSRPAAAPRTTSSARRSGCRSSARSTRTAATTRGSAG